MPYNYEFDEDYETDGDEDFLDDEVVTFVCEDCDHRWEDDSEGSYSGPENHICSMCGSSSVIEL
ncbi:hypothetical protein EHQ53_04725 [Leptospira langatensis]|uniref:Uncharacterized protein n=1 Tax=Leptospira langatensis TaxID=2484983 RepID=A0A5F1ZYK2_9LEPT|nr:hypothetical protein [Leptospira langatensis]TGK00332.1 hypothetical protein EHO57_12590 [Leptospira langatensis]TGL42820.1 hypothetical protein EHQ53_04725 [Leptospira langatensis]